MIVSSLPFQFAHIEGEGGDVQYHPSGKMIATCGADTLVRLFDAFDVNAPPIDVVAHSGAVNSIAFSTKGDRFATASDDVSTSVCVYSYPRWEENYVLCKFTLPARHISFNAEGGIACAGDDGIIKLYPLAVEGQVPFVMKGHDGSILHLNFDPTGQYLASSGSDGTLRIWKVPQLESSEEPVCEKTFNTFSKSNAITRNRHKTSWGMQGDLLAVPSGNQIDIYQKPSWTKSFSLNDHHSNPTVAAYWSPNSKYLASIDMSGVVVIWDVSVRECLKKYSHSTQISSLSWDPKSNSIAMIDYDGRLAVWSGVIPSGKIGPHEHENPENDYDFEVASEDGGEDAADTANVFMDDEASESADEKKHEPVSKSRPAKESQQKLNFFSKPSDLSDSESDSQEEQNPALAETIEFSSHIQDSFQSGSTPSEDGRRFLACNLVGLIISREEAMSSSIEIEFHNTEEFRPVRFTDRYRFSMAALGELGAAFASKIDEETPSTIYYRPFNTWTHNSEWTLQLPPGDEVKALCVGTKWTAVATAKRYIRIFTFSGIQRYVFSISGPVVAMAGRENKLFIAYHTSEGFVDTRDQQISYALLDVDECCQLQNGAVAISVGSELRWIGFTENDMLATYDTESVIRVLAPIFGAKWVPILDFNAKKKAKETHFIVGITEDKVLSYACKNGREYPATLPRPIIQTTSFSVPLLMPEHPVTKHEDVVLKHDINLRQLQKLYEENDDEDEAQDLAIKMNRSRALMDAEVLKMIELSCKSERGLRSLDLSNLLHLKKAIDSAIAIAEANRQYNLVERMKLVAASNEEKGLEDRLMPAESTKRIPTRARETTNEGRGDVHDANPAKHARTQDSVASLSHYAASEKSSVVSFDFSSQPTVADGASHTTPTKAPLQGPFSKKTPTSTEQKSNIFETLNQLADKGASKKQQSKPSTSPFSKK